MDFTHEFCYLGSLINYTLNDSSDINRRITKATCAMGALKFIWDSEEVELQTKINLYKAIPLNLALWGHECWARKAQDIKKLEAFHHKSMRRILHINMQRVKDERIKNSEIRKQFNNIDTIEDTIIKRQLQFVGKIMRQGKDKVPGNMISATIKGHKRKAGRPQTNTRDSIYSSLQRILPEIPETGDINWWGDLAKDELLWNQLIKNMNNDSFDWSNYKNNNNNNNKNTNKNTNQYQQSYYNQGNSTPHTPSPKTRQQYHNNTTTPNTSIPTHNSNRISQHLKNNDLYTVTPARRQLNINTDQLSIEQSKKILNINNNTTQRELRLRYKLLARKYHPDKWVAKCEFTKTQGAEYFKDISNAYMKAKNWCQK